MPKAWPPALGTTQGTFKVIWIILTVYRNATLKCYRWSPDVKVESNPCRIEEESLKAQTSIIHFWKEEVAANLYRKWRKQPKKTERENIDTRCAMQTQTLTRRGCTAAQAPLICLLRLFLSFFLFSRYLFIQFWWGRRKKKKRSPSCWYVK